MGKKIIQGTLEVTDAGTTDNSVVRKQELNEVNEEIITINEKIEDQKIQVKRFI